MFDQIKNRKGEKLYILTVVSTNNIMPHITVDTWKECKRKFEIFCKEDNSDRFFFEYDYDNNTTAIYTRDGWKY